MTDKQQRARELLASKGRFPSAGTVPFDVAVDLIAAALPDEQPEQGPACVACDDKPTAENNPCAVCGRLLAPPAGPAVEALLADLRERAAKVVETADLFKGNYLINSVGRVTCGAAIRALPLIRKRQNG